MKFELDHELEIWGQVTSWMLIQYRCMHVTRCLRNWEECFKASFQWLGELIFFITIVKPFEDYIMHSLFPLSRHMVTIGEQSKSLLSDISYDKTEEEIEVSELRSGRKWKRARPSAPPAEDGEPAVDELMSPSPPAKPSRKKKSSGVCINMFLLPYSKLLWTSPKKAKILLLDIYYSRETGWIG